MTQNINKAMWADETSHWMQHAHKTCVRLRRWEDQRRLPSLSCYDTAVNDTAVTSSIQNSISNN